MICGSIAGNIVFDDLIGDYWMFSGNNIVLFFVLFQGAILNRLHASPFYTLQRVGHSSCCINTLVKYRWIDSVRQDGGQLPRITTFVDKKVQFLP